MLLETQTFSSRREICSYHALPDTLSALTPPARALRVDSVDLLKPTSLERFKTLSVDHDRQSLSGAKPAELPRSPFWAACQTRRGWTNPNKRKEVRPWLRPGPLGRFS